MENIKDFYIGDLIKYKDYLFGSLADHCDIGLIVDIKQKGNVTETTVMWGNKAVHVYADSPPTFYFLGLIEKIK